MARGKLLPMEGLVLSQTKEIEFKNLLTQAEAKRLLAAYPSFTHSFKQTNVYYDTKEKQLKKQSLGLRIRLFATSAEQTLKVPLTKSQHSLTEITDTLTLAQAKKFWLAETVLVPSQVATKLNALQINPKELSVIGHATTIRRQSQLAAGLLVLDQTIYPDTTSDYELELEVTQSNTSAFRDILVKQNIQKRPVQNKIVRTLQHQ